MKKIALGDIFEIPLSQNQKTYGHYLFLSKMGPIVQVLNTITKTEMNLIQIRNLTPMFPPVIVGLFAALKNKKWRIIGNIPITNFIHPLFISTEYNQKTGEAKTWFTWDGEKYTKIGTTLTSEQKKLEFLVVWNPTSLVERIETQKMAFPYFDLIQHNKFIPKD